MILTPSNDPMHDLWWPKKVRPNRYGSPNTGYQGPFWLAGDIPESTAYTVFDPLTATTETDARINLANPGTRNASSTAFPTWSNGSGWQFNGSTQFIDTNVVVDGNTTVVIMYEGPTTSNRYLFGVFQASPTRQFSSMPNSGGNSYFEYGSANGSPEIQMYGGTFGLSQLGFYRNKEKAATPIAWSGAATTRTISLGAQNQGTNVNFFSGRVLRYAAYNFQLSDAQVQAVMNEMLKIGYTGLDTSYSSRVLATNPVAYIPCDNKPGFSYCRDMVGNTMFCTAQGAFVGQQTGKYGPAMQAPNNGSLIEILRPSPALSLALGNPNEHSCAMWVYVTSTPAAQVRLSNLYTTGLAEYGVLEVRSGLTLTLFQRENGVDQNINPITTLTNNTWHHIVYFNSLSNGVYGAYVDGVKYEYAKTTGGFVNTAVAKTTPELFSLLNGRFQHVSYYNRMITQSEVNSLL